MTTFKIEQVAIAPKDPERAIDLLKKLGMDQWHHDTVVAAGQVFGYPGRNTAELAFNYQGIEGKELEVLNYVQGQNWIDTRGKNIVSHLGMHCSEKELTEYRQFFASEGIQVAQEVNTESHTNPVIAGKRQYNYVIFDTKHILGVDLKFIVRKDVGPKEDGFVSCLVCDTQRFRPVGFNGQAHCAECDEITNHQEVKF